MFLLQICERSLEHSESIQANWEIVSDRLQWRITWKSMFTSRVALQPEREKNLKELSGYMLDTSRLVSRLPSG